MKYYDLTIRKKPAPEVVFETVYKGLTKEDAEDYAHYWVERINDGNERYGSDVHISYEITEGKKMYEFRIDDYSGLYIEDPEEGCIWHGDEEDLDIQFEDGDSEVWEEGWQEKVFTFCREHFEIDADQIEFCD